MQLYQVFSIMCQVILKYLFLWMIERNALPSRQEEEKSLIFTPGQPSVVRRDQSSKASRADISSWPGTTTSEICNSNKPMQVNKSKVQTSVNKTLKIFLIIINNWFHSSLLMKDAQVLCRLMFYRIHNLNKNLRR